MGSCGELGSSKETAIPGRTGLSGATTGQATSCDHGACPPKVSSTGASVEHEATARGQRGWNEHPGGGWSGLAGSPWRRVLSWSRSGTADSNALV